MSGIARVSEERESGGRHAKTDPRLLRCSSTNRLSSTSPARGEGRMAGERERGGGGERGGSERRKVRVEGSQ